MGISSIEINRHYAGIRQWMKVKGVDCVLVAGKADHFNRGNVRYITTLGNGGYCLFPLEGIPVLFVGRKAEFLSRKELPIELKETTNPVEGIKAELARFDHGNKIGTIGLEATDNVNAFIKENYSPKLVDAIEIFEQMRSIKSAEEIEKMRVAAWIADKVFYMLKDLVRPGLIDFEIYGEVKRLIYGLGCEYSMDLIDADGAKMNMKFTPVGDRLSADGTLFLEITPVYEGYYAQLPVIMPVVRPPDHFYKMAAVWKQALDAGMSLLKPGIKVFELYHVMQNKVREGGFISPFRPGHAIGLDAIDFWSITESNETVLKPGMTIAVHPSVLKEPGGDGIGMGYTFLITETGAERFSKVNLAAMYNL
jgi:Xaa-Pro dipeptidase